MRQVIPSATFSRGAIRFCLHLIQILPLYCGMFDSVWTLTSQVNTATRSLYRFSRQFSLFFTTFSGWYPDRLVLLLTRGKWSSSLFSSLSTTWLIARHPVRNQMASLDVDFGFSSFAPEKKPARFFFSWHVFSSCHSNRSVCGKWQVKHGG